RPLAMGAGALLQLAAGAALTSHWIEAAPEQGLIGGIALGAVMIALAGGFSSRCLDRRRSNAAEPGEGGSAERGEAAAYLSWATVWWLAAGFLEIDRHAPAMVELDVGRAFIGATVLAATFA